MSILIKGMRMPENCGKCPFIIEEDIDFDICRQCGAGKNGYIHEEDIDGFPADCPLVNLGKRGRLIDADSLKDKLKFINEAEHQIYGRESWGFTAKCISAIDDAPTVIEAEDG